MATVVALLLLAAVVLAVLRAFGVGGRAGGGGVDLGWLAIACVITAVWTIPAWQAIT